MNRLDDGASKELATVKERYSESSLISLGEALIDGKQCIIIRGANDKVIFVEAKTLKIVRTLQLPQNVSRFNVRWAI